MSKLIKRFSFDGFQIYERNDENNYLKILSDFKSGKIKYTVLNHGNLQRDVFLIEVDGRQYVLKWDREMDPRLEKRVWQFISGPYYSNLIKRIAHAKQEGCHIIGNIYLVAEKAAWRQSVEAYILQEYIPGKPLSQCTNLENYKSSIRDCIRTLHKYKLASNDAHSGNFILTTEGLKIIDLSDRGALAICQANDALTLQRLYQIELGLTSPIYHLIAFKEKLKQLSRRLRGKV